MKRYDELIELTKKMVNVPSSYFNEKNVMAVAFEWLEKAGLNPVHHYYEEAKAFEFKGENVICRIKGKKEGPVICLNGHLDTVKLTSNWSMEPYAGEVKDGKLYGLGALDMKSGCAAIMVAVRDFVKANPDFGGEIVLTLVSDEEGPFGLGTNALIEEGYLDDVDCAIVTEPSGSFVGKEFPLLGLGAKGTVVYQVEFYGKSAHAAIPEEGINAAVDAAKFFYEASRQPINVEDILGKGRICPLSITADGGACSVPEYAKVVIHRHIVRGEDMDSILAEAEDIMKRVNPKSKYKIAMRPAPSEDSIYYKPYIIDKENKYVLEMQESIKAVCGDYGEIGYITSIGDFNYLGTRLNNVPAILIGPSGKNLHQADEYVNTDTIEKTADIIEDYLGRILLD